MSQSKIRTNVYLSKIQNNALKQIGKEHRIPAAEVLRRILDSYLALAPTGQWTPGCAFPAGAKSVKP
jgi:hypothetical protein